MDSSCKITTKEHIAIADIKMKMKYEDVEYINFFDFHNYHTILNSESSEDVEKCCRLVPVFKCPSARAISQIL